MSLRESLQNQKTPIQVAAAALLLLVAGAALAYQFKSSRLAAPGDYPAFFSDDDGKTHFTDRESHITPFEHKGRPAVRAHLYRCGNDTFVAYLERYTDAARKSITDFERTKAAWKQGDPIPDTAAVDRALSAGFEVKRPGDPAWTPKSAAASILQNIPCPHANAHTPERVYP